MISERTVHLISDGFDLSKRRSLPPFLPNCQQRDSVCAVSRWIRSCVCARAGVERGQAADFQVETSQPTYI